jgi:translation initiation factor 2B subunit (eIF-2B alpha/beta/delta family)
MPTKAQEALTQYVTSSLTELRTDHINGARMLARQSVVTARTICEAGLQRKMPARSACLLLYTFCRELIQVRQSMAPMTVVAARIYDVFRHKRPTEALQAAMVAINSLETSLREAPAGIAHRLAPYLHQHTRIVTLSYSATIYDAMLANRENISMVTILESRPGSEGVKLAERLVEKLPGVSIRLLPDSAIMLATAESTACVFGADAILSSGHTVNKVGSYPLALAARATGIPCFVLGETLKIAPLSWQWNGEEADLDWLNVSQIPDVTLIAPIFERVPLELVRLITEDGLYDTTQILQRAQDLDDAYSALQVIV